MSTFKSFYGLLKRFVWLTVRNISNVSRMYLVFMYIVPFASLAVLNMLIFLEIRRASARRAMLSNQEKREHNLATMLLVVVLVNEQAFCFVNKHLNIIDPACLLILYMSPTNPMKNKVAAQDST